VGSFGDRLRREREMRGIGLEEIATATKISARNLRALEQEKFDQLPGGIFNKGFVRAYAKFLGIDEEHIIAEYETASRDTEAAREKKLEEEFKKAEFRKPKEKSDLEMLQEPKSEWGTIAIIVLIAAMAYGGYNYYQRKKADGLQQQARLANPVTSTEAPSPATDESATPAPAANTAGPATGTTATVNEPSKPAAQISDIVNQSVAPITAIDENSSTAAIELRIKVNQVSWVLVKADGRTLLSTTLHPGAERAFKASDKVEMVLGNADGVEGSYNGKPVENLNNVQDVRKITFTPTGYQ
jgi:cytoskeleton protein RodZ